MRALLSAAVLVAFLVAPAAQSRDPRSLARAALAQIDGELTVAGLRGNVRVVRDTWGVPHIYAQSVDDLFFAQGFVLAQDRLWQMEVWRRTVEGRLAEILGPSAISRDRVARMLKYRGTFDEREWTAYHPDAKRMLSAYAAGVNAFIDTHRQKLPVEFVMTGITPERWTPESLLSRQNSFGDATSELQLARSVAQLGAAEANKRRNPDPWEELTVPKGLDVSAIAASFDAITAATRGGGGPVRPQIVDPGSNNWVVSGRMSTTGKPVVVNDPHREVVNPSLRYIVHLNAPGWNVVGSSEPPFAGVAIGHNDRVAWGLTIVGTDQHDVYVEQLNPADHSQVKWQDGWEAIRVVREQIGVKDGAPQTIELKFTRHGPIFFEDTERHLAYALRSALHEPGTAPYLAGLRLSQAKDCKDFLEQANYWHSPSENLICGDVDGNIAWQASALTPARKGWSGRLPVPGTGEYEWTGFRRDLPREFNPERGFIATANHNVQPKGYSPPFMFKNADTRFERITRVMQLLVPGRKYSLDDHERMQADAYSLRAANDRPAFRGWTARDPDVEKARAAIASWDAVYTKDSTAAAIYETFRDVAGGGGRGGGGVVPPLTQSSIEPALRKAIDALMKTQGADWSQWRWGRMHTRAFPHPFIEAFNLPTVERPGGAGTVAADGASYREILDVSNWDNSRVTNVPGQSGQPESPYYGNLLPLWAENRYFPLVYSDGAVRQHAKHTLTLKPR